MYQKRFLIPILSSISSTILYNKLDAIYSTIPYSTTASTLFETTSTTTTTTTTTTTSTIFEVHRQQLPSTTTSTMTISNKPCESFEYFREQMTQAIYFAIDQDEDELSRPSEKSPTQGFLRRREQFSLD